MNKQTASRTARKAIREKYSWIADGNYFDLVASLLEKEGFVAQARRVNSDVSPRGLGEEKVHREYVYSYQKWYAYLTHATFMGEFTDLQFAFNRTRRKET